MTAPSDQRRVYHISPWRRYGVWLIFGPVILFLLALWMMAPTREPGAWILLACYGGGYALVSLFVTLLTGRARLELSSGGPRLRQTGYTLETAWTNIAGLHLIRGREGFITEAPLEGPGAARLASLREFGMLGGAALYDAEQQALLAERRFIPIEAFAWHLRHGNLRADIARFAPHLQTALAALDDPAVVDANELKGRKLWKVLALLSPFLIGVIALASSPQPFQDKALRIAAAVFIPLFALRAAYSAWSFFRTRAWWLGIFFVGLALVLFFLSVSAWMELSKLGR